MFADFLAINNVKIVYTLEKNHVLENLSLKNNFILIDLDDYVFEQKVLLHLYNITKYLTFIKNLKYKSLVVYGNDRLAFKVGVKRTNRLNDETAIINCYDGVDIDFFGKDKIIFDFSKTKYGFSNLAFKDKNVTFFEVRQYLGQIFTKSGAKLIYDSLVRNRVNP